MNKWACKLIGKHVLVRETYSNKVLLRRYIDTNLRTAWRLPGDRFEINDIVIIGFNTRITMTCMSTINRQYVPPAMTQFYVSPKETVVVDLENYIIDTVDEALFCDAFEFVTL